MGKISITGGNGGFNILTEKEPLIGIIAILLISFIVAVLPILGAPATPTDYHRLAFDNDTNYYPYNYSTSFTPVVWLYDQTNNSVSSGTVSYEYKDVNGNVVITSGTATNNGDGSYTGATINMQSYAGGYINVKFSIPQNSNTIVEQLAIYAGSEAASKGPSWKIVPFNTSMGPSWDRTQDHKVYMKLYSDSGEHMENLQNTPTLSVTRSNGFKEINGAAMTYEDHGVYIYTISANTVSSDDEYYFEIESKWGSASVTGGNSRYAIATAGFNLEAVGSQGDEGTPDMFDIEQVPNFPDPLDNVTISAEGFDNLQLNLTVYFTVNNLTQGKVNMTWDGSTHIYTAAIGEFYLDYEVSYYISATDGTNVRNSSTYDFSVTEAGGAPNHSHSYLNTGVYYFGYSRAGTAYDGGGDTNYDGTWTNGEPDGVYYLQQPSNSYRFFRNMTTIKMRTFIMDSRGKPVHNLTNVTAWLQANKTQAADEKNRLKNMTWIGEGIYYVSWEGSPAMSGTTVTWSNDSKAIWGQYDSGQIYSVYVDIDEDGVADENNSWLAYAFGDTFWGSSEAGKSPNHNGIEQSTSCANNCHGGAMVDSVSRIDGEPTCPDCHGVEKTANGGSWPISGSTASTDTILYGNSTAHPRVNTSGNVTYCGNSTCHNIPWNSTVLPEPAYIPGYGTGESLETIFNSSGYPDPSMCAGICHNYLNNTLPGEGGHNKMVNCKFCHGSYHRQHDLNNYSITVTDDVSRGTPGYVGTGGESGSGNYIGDCYKDCHRSQVQHCGNTGPPVPCDECHRIIEKAPMHRENIRPYDDRINCGGCHQAVGAITTYNTSFSMDPVRVGTEIYHSRGSGNKWNKTGERIYWGINNNSCRYCHGRAYHNGKGLGNIENFRGTNILNGTINSTSFWCASCHIETYSSGGDNYDDMVTIYNTTYGIVPPEITANSTWMSNRPEYHDHHALGYIDETNSSTFPDSRCFDCHNRTPDINVGMDVWMLNISRYTGYTWVSYNDSANNNLDDDFTLMENTVYLSGNNFGPDYSYKVAYYDNSGAKVGTDTVNANSLTNLSSNQDLYGVWASGIWYAQVFNSSISTPATYESSNEDALTEDTFVVNVEAMSEFPYGTALPFAISFILYILVRKKIRT